MRRPCAVAAPLTAVLLAAGCGETLLSVSSDGWIEVAVTIDGNGPGNLHVVVDGGLGQAVPGNGTVALIDLREGTHVVRLTGFGAECGVEGSNPREVVVRPDGTASVVFHLRCSPG